MKKLRLNKKTVWITVGILAAIGLIILLIIIINPFAKKTGSQKQEFTEKLETMAADFYENNYFKQADPNDLKKFETIGIKVDLDNLSRCGKEDSKVILEQFKNEKTKKECDKKQTQVAIYPQAPYGQKDYKLEVTLVCGFEEE